MRIVCFEHDGRPTFGCRVDDQVRPFAGESGSSIDIVLDNLAAGRKPDTAGSFPSSGLRFLPPVPRPGKVICIGLNYADHASEGGHPHPTYPAVFLRSATSLTGHGQPLIKPLTSQSFDFEAELAVVIGRRARHTRREDALAFIAGYSCFNDGSLRDFQRKSTQWTMGKNFDRSGSFGPDLVTPDELPTGPGNLAIRASLNGRILQNGNTADMIFDVPTIIETLSEVMTLEPGDVIATGTPAGVGFAREPPIFMKSGDVCTIEIKGIGVLSNTIEGEIRRDGTEFYVYV